MNTQTISLDEALRQAAALEAVGRLAEAEEIYRRIVQSQPSFHPAWHALGLLAHRAGNLEQAAELVERAIVAGGEVGLYFRNLAELYRRRGLLEKAMHAGNRAVELAPGDLDAWYNYGLACTDAGEFARAIECYRKALEINPDHGLSWNNLGSALEQTGDKDEAEKAYAKAVRLNPQHAEAQNNLGAIQSERGLLDEARTSFQAAIDAKPDFVEAHYNLSALKHYSRDDPHLAMLESVYEKRVGLTDHARIRYGFALGKALDDIGEDDRAFAAYEEGNRLQHALLPVDDARADAMLARIIETFDEKFFAARQDWLGVRDDSRVPVFIVGMPRSGTTLLEQILCSHPSVYGAGELGDLNEVVMQAAAAGPQRPFIGGVTTLTEADMRRIGEEYLQRVWQLSPDSVYITDKMPANFFYLGLIHLALPGAKIIHAMRDPMDSCFSCYTRLFNDTMDFAYDQVTLGRYYARYMTLMQHWRRVLPQGTVLDLPYEDMVADTEGRARRVLEFVGLPWDDNCLRFHENKRLVKTASVTQVRRPIYKTSVARWKRYARHLRPLYELVKDYRPDDDADELIGATTGLSAKDWHLQGIEHYRQNQFNEALDCYDRALALQPEFPQAFNSKGYLLQDMDRLKEARACFEQALALAPQYIIARLNLGIAQLKLGDWERGWENYEARWEGAAEAHDGSFSRVECPLPQWHGEADTQGKRLLVITEQGFGDTFQFSRYLALAARQFSRVGFVCSPATLRLMEWSYGDEVMLMPQMPTDFGAWDLQCPLMSLPRAFHTRPDNIPASPSYLRVPDKASSNWLDRLQAVAPDSFRIGITWVGRKEHNYDARRSLAFKQLGPLLNDTRITWVSLQKRRQGDTPPPVPAGVEWLDWTGELADFADTAALVSNLDLVLSIDSAMVHLAGALGVPVWMMDRFDNEWRWLRHREDSPWYPSLRIFRQPTFGDWSGVIARVAQALAATPMPERQATSRRAQPAAQPAVIPEQPGNMLTPEQAAQLAGQLQASGRLQEAEQLLLQILQADAHNGHVLHLLGVVYYQTGRQQAALQLIEQAIGFQPQVALFHSNLAEMCRQQGRVDDAIRHGRHATEIDPNMASAHSNLGIAYYDAKDYDAAEACHRKALELDPKQLQSLNNMGSIQRARKDLPGAAEWYRKALAVNPDYVESLSNLGAVLVEDGHAAKAVSSLEKAVALAPDYVEALCNLGLAYIKEDRLDEAAALLERSLKLRPDYPEALIGMGRVCNDQDRWEEARRYFDRVVEIAPDKPEAWCQLAALATEMGEADNAEQAFDKALAIDPEMADAIGGIGNLRLEAGKLDEAVELLERAIEIKPDSLGARFQLALARKTKPDDDNLAKLQEMKAELDDWEDDKRLAYHYALGKAYDELKQYDQAFPHFLEGARLKRARLKYDPNADATISQRIITHFTQTRFSNLRGAGDPSTMPIFVLGMPRSGTTLTEQIIASHPEVHGAGELPDLMTVAQHLAPGQPEVGYPDNIRLLKQPDLTRWGAEYVHRLSAHAPGARRITDKMPANYYALGLIPLMLPNAKIVHVRRNPVDTCVSCFTRLFQRHQDATYDLAELGRHYANYARLMEHWRKVLPEGSFLEVQYEDIVADMETQARRLIDWCGLEWDDACLEFHKNERSIRTASVTQVRQPIYNSSVERWRHYEKFLGPLLEALGEFRPK